MAVQWMRSCIREAKSPCSPPRVTWILNGQHSSLQVRSSATSSISLPMENRAGKLTAQAPAQAERNASHTSNQHGSFLALAKWPFCSASVTTVPLLESLLPAEAWEPQQSDEESLAFFSGAHPPPVSAYEKPRQRSGMNFPFSYVFFLKV